MIIAIIIMAKKQGQAVSVFKADAAKNGIWRTLAGTEVTLCGGRGTAGLLFLLLHCIQSTADVNKNATKRSKEQLLVWRGTC